jgi:WhiB family redox-sensing transcriptional regulator
MGLWVQVPPPLPSNIEEVFYMQTITYGFDPTKAACHGVDLENFFPVGRSGRRPKGADIAVNSVEYKQRLAVQTFCNVCEVKDDCYELALHYDDDMDGLSVSGVWGGTTEADRRAMRREVREVA